MSLHPISDFPSPWFHSVCVLLQPGSVILPGNMGRIMKLYKPGTDRLIQEEIYERARLHMQPEAPSRLACTFVCPTKTDAIAFDATGSVKLNQWYLVEPVEPVRNVFVADYRNWASPTSLRRPFTDAAFQPVCREYWQEPALACRELLHRGSLRVISAV